MLHQSLRTFGTYSDFARDGFACKDWNTSLPDVLELQPKVFRDARGFFLETYNQQNVRGHRNPRNFRPGQSLPLRKGDAPRPPLSIAPCAGQALPRDRGRSVGRGRGHSIGLADISENGPACCSPRRSRIKSIFRPGFAHGFVALTDTVQFLYKCSDFYDPGERARHPLERSRPGDLLGRLRIP